MIVDDGRFHCWVPDVYNDESTIAFVDSTQDALVAMQRPGTGQPVDPRVVVDQSLAQARALAATLLAGAAPEEHSETVAGTPLVAFGYVFAQAPKLALFSATACARLERDAMSIISLTATRPGAAQLKDLVTRLAHTISLPGQPAKKAPPGWSSRNLGSVIFAVPVGKKTSGEFELHDPSTSASLFLNVDSAARSALDVSYFLPQDKVSVLDRQAHDLRGLAHEMVGKETTEQVHRLRPAATLPAPAPPLDDHHALRTAHLRRAGTTAPSLVAMGFVPKLADAQFAAIWKRVLSSCTLDKP